MIELKNINFRYKSKFSQAGLSDINLRVKPGELVLLTGESGCGKSSILRVINGLIPNYHEGDFSGQLVINGKDCTGAEIYEISSYVGSVFQNPRTQFFNVDTTSELAFGCENHAMPPEEIKEKIFQVADEFKITSLLGKNIFSLSGGEKQKIACASVVMTDTPIIILDEPSSNLDISAIENLKAVLSEWKKQGKTIVVAEHRIYYLMDLIDRMIYVKDGKIDREFSASEFKALSKEEVCELGLRVRDRNHIDFKGGGDSEFGFAGAGGSAEFHNQMDCESAVYEKAVCEYSGHRALDIDSLSFPLNSVIAVVGLNGSGKTTFSRSLCGLLKDKHSLLTYKNEGFNWKKRIPMSYMVMQDVNHQLFTETVLDEVLLSMVSPDKDVAMTCLEKLDLDSKSTRHPMTLSGGEKQRLAIASALVCDKKVFIFDEPTSGLDLRHMHEVSAQLKELACEDRCIFVVTHDYELMADCCDHFIEISDGKIVAQGSM